MHKRYTHTLTTEELLLNDHIIYGSSRLGTYATNEFINDTLPIEMNLPANQRFELTDHLGTVRAVVTGEKTNGEANILALTDYYPGGMDMPGREFQGTVYKYGFHGEIFDSEVNDLYDYGFRVYDPRLNRFTSVDPIAASYPELTPYQFASNRLIDGVDLDGLEYLDYREARIEVNSGDVELKIQNFTRAMRTAWYNMGTNPSNWGKNTFGMDRRIGNIKMVSPPSLHETKIGRLSTDTSNPTSKATQQKVERGKGTYRSPGSFRYTSKNVSSGSPRAGNGAKGVLVFNAINWGAHMYIIYSFKKDNKLVDEHLIALGLAIEDLKVALLQGQNYDIVIPDKYLNRNDLSSILNVILQGQNITDDPMIYDIGIEIVKKISKNYRSEYVPVDYSQSNEGADVTKQIRDSWMPKYVPKIDGGENRRVELGPY